MDFMERRESRQKVLQVFLCTGEFIPFRVVCGHLLIWRFWSGFDVAMVCWQSGGCDFWVWLDSVNSMTPFVKQLLVNLRDSVRGLERKNKDLASVLAETGSKVDEQVAEIARLKKLLAEKDADLEELKEDVKKLEKERFFFRLVLVLFVAIVFGAMFSK